jgi:hypothetical protein
MILLLFLFNRKMFYSVVILFVCLKSIYITHDKVVRRKLCTKCAGPSGRRIVCCPMQNTNTIKSINLNLLAKMHPAFIEFLKST